MTRRTQFAKGNARIITKRFRLTLMLTAGAEFATMPVPLRSDEAAA
jgi:hypothetical protein